jgi:dTDP-glucose pyrophosphorylase
VSSHPATRHANAIPPESLRLDLSNVDNWSMGGEILISAKTFGAAFQLSQGLKMGLPEEAAWRRGFISGDELRERGELLFKSGYGAYLVGLLDGWGRAA